MLIEFVSHKFTVFYAINESDEFSGQDLSVFSFI